MKPPHIIIMMAITISNLVSYIFSQNKTLLVLMTKASFISYLNMTKKIGTNPVKNIEYNHSNKVTYLQ